MSDQRIGLAELCERVKQDLLTSSGDPDEAPLLSVEQVTLELQVTAVREGKAGIKVYVAELGGGARLDEMQKVTVTLKPLLSHDARLEYLAQNHPEKLHRVQLQSLGLFKGHDQLGVDYDDD